MIEISNLTKTFDKSIILDNINLKIEKGNVYALLGKNGVGKTTLINIIIDLILPDKGNILINGKEHNKLDKKDKKNLGIVGEDLALLEELNGREFLNFIGKIYELPKNMIDKRIKDLFNYFFEDEKDLKKNISRYSTGMKKKIAFCAAVLHTPDILILDEPFSGLDPLVANQMIEFLKAYQQKDRAMLVSSHDLSYVEKIATHIGVLNDSKLLFNSSIEDFTNLGTNSIDSALLQILKPNTSELSKIDWL
jgi:ABC-2 type transport system ATP-binding protein